MKGKRMTRIFAVLVAGCVILCLFAGCGGRETGAGKVYYLNFKPEQKAAWEQLAKTYTDQTGVPVTVVTAASIPESERIAWSMRYSHPSCGNR